MKKKSSAASTIGLVLVLVVGFSLLLYPTISDWWNSMHQSRAVASYTQKVSELDKTDYQNVWQAARSYNQTLNQKPNRFFMTDEDRVLYESVLNVAGNGVMGTIEIKKLNVNLPIYHGTNEAVLQVAIGHVEGSSLPTGDVGTHCVLSGHRGLPSAKLFTELDKMQVGDTFQLHVLDEIFTYEVDQILTVLPEEVEALAIDPLQDYCTLVTCTPYGINTHRMLVRGHRVETVVEKAPVIIRSDASVIDPWMVVPFLCIPGLFVLLVMALFPRKKRK